MTALATPLDPDRSVVDQLRERVATIERSSASGGQARQRVATLPALSDLVPLHAGATYGVDSAALALALAAGASQAGEWVGFAGWADFGAEAAVELGVELSRTVVVPEVGEHWLEVTAALVDVLRVVVLRPPTGLGARVDARAAGVLDSRLRTRSSVLVVWGDWPRVEARLSVERSQWHGPGSGGSGQGAGSGRLHERRARVAVRRGARPPERAELWFGEVPGALSVAPTAPEPVWWEESG